MTYRQDLWEIAADHHGIVTTAQAGEVGIPADQLRKLALRGALERVGHGVYRHRGVPADDRTELAASLAAVGEDAFLAGDTVLSMFGLADADPRMIHIGTRRRHRGRLPQTVRLVAMPQVGADEVTAYDGLPAHRLDHVLLDALDRLPPDRVARAARDAERLDLITPDAAADIVAAAGRRSLGVASASEADRWASAG